MNKAEMFALSGYFAAKNGAVELNASAQVPNSKHNMVDALD